MTTTSWLLNGGMMTIPRSGRNGIVEPHCHHRHLAPFDASPRNMMMNNNHNHNNNGPVAVSNGVDSSSSEEEMMEKVNNKMASPEWRQPTGSGCSHRLQLTNSLTRKKEPFVPDQGNRVNWYICGPTVYDSAHLGHARSYVSFDIIRRVMKKYLGYDVNYVMNITDIDDKIIKRARQRYLYGQYVEQGHSAEKILEDVSASLDHLKEKYGAETNLDQRQSYQVEITKMEHSLSQHKQQRDKKEKNGALLLEEAKDALSDWLDEQSGATVTDHSIFDALAKKFETEFLADLASLNVLPPDVLTRVSEYVPEIVAYVRTIIDNGYAYEANGSVYFDTAAFHGHKGHHYAKLVPEAYRTTAADDAAGQNTGEKRNASDFALWKRCKPGEPYWPSPWGQGRPGWHIECSAMASAVCGGPRLDVHAGGFDLKFPHHDNELAQSEAYFQCDQWVNYFLHAGTLQIAGLKMSKSLKNFITIRQALREYTPRQIRLWFLMHRWEECLDYSHANLQRALQFEKTVQEFLLCCDSYTRKFGGGKNSSSSYFRKWGDEEMRLYNEHLRDAKFSVDAALRDSIDTRSALEAIRELISRSNAYIARKSSSPPDCSLLDKVSGYVREILGVFGAGEEDGDGKLVDGGVVENGDSSSSTCKERLITPYVEALCDFREQVRRVAKEKNIPEILAECDRIRDRVLPDLGVRLEDRDGHTVVKLMDPETLAKQREQERQMAEQRRLEQERKRALTEAKEAQRRVPPSEMFRRQQPGGDDAEREEGEGKCYSRFDERGIPTHDAQGAQLGKKTRQKLVKMYEAQEKKYRDYVTTTSLEQAKTNGGVSSS